MAQGEEDITACYAACYRFYSLVVWIVPIDVYLVVTHGQLSDRRVAVIKPVGKSRPLPSLYSASRSLALNMQFQRRTGPIAPSK